ncbi:outer membrane autotransporter [Calocera cornea HHB12733]|uniref:Outer membrane autotransporter n=1 Tax=Calocera cornea HHB12733 TaxID=1353952 RepID=A0A165D099_9BASI|nr:outer membrane autotransporter [Calocera cornea HHB12733]
MLGIVPLLLAASLALATPTELAPRWPPVKRTECNGKEYVYQGLTGFGTVASNFRDKFGDTLSFGSSAAVEPKSWKLLPNGTLTGTLWMLPDRGWNTNGTTNFQPRVHIFDVWLTPLPDGAPEPAPQNLIFGYKDTVLFFDPSGKPTTGLDANTLLSFDHLPALPAAQYPGDGWGGPGNGDTRVTMDCEGIVLDHDGTFWISDEYGPYIYHFTRDGAMFDVLAPMDALIPRRNGTLSFASDNPPIFNPSAVPVPANPDTGRSNNQGFEGLAADPARKHMFALLQSATVQDDGTDVTKRRWTRLLKYTREQGKYVYTDAWALGLPTYLTAANATRVAAQSEMHYLFEDQFFVLPRDSSAGHGMPSSLSLYRHIDIYDISGASSLHTPALDAANGTIAPNGTLRADITPALYCSFIDFNDNAELAKFGLHNGGPDDDSLLNEKWEGMVVLPADGSDAKDGWYYVIATNDNDFVTQDGYMNFGKIQYKDTSGFNFNNEALVFKVQLPKGARPFN